MISEPDDISKPLRALMDYSTREQMQLGYPIKMEVFEPEILKYAVNWVPIKSENNWQRVILTFAEEGLELVESESLEMIRKLISTRFSGNSTISRYFENPLPRNILAVYLEQFNFELGPYSQDLSNEQISEFLEGDYFTYQKKSEHVQAVYYNLHGLQFLSAVVYYPVPNGEMMYLKNDEALIYLTITSAEPYPKKDRGRQKRYGRYCKTAGKQVLVYRGGKDGPICHLEFDHFSDIYMFASCTECLEDALAYKWREPKNKMPTSTTKHRYKPKILEEERAVGILGENGSWRLTYRIAEKGLELVEPESLEMIRQKLLRMFGNDSETAQFLVNSLPRNTISLDFPTFAFPKEVKAKDSDFTYQQLSENLQIALYNKNGIQFMTSMTYYPVPNGEEMNLRRDRALMHLAQMSAEPYPLMDRNKQYNKTKHNKYGRFCKTVGRRVVIDCSGKHGTVRHKDFNSALNKYVYTFCEECLVDYFTYKWEEPKKLDHDAPGPSKSTKKSKSSAQAIGKHSIMEDDVVSDFDENVELEESLEDHEWEEPRNDEPMVFNRDLLTSPETINAIRLALDSTLIDSTRQKELEDQMKACNVQAYLAIFRSILSSEVGIPELLKMNSMPENTKIPMIHKDTKETLPDDTWPQIKDFVIFLVNNPDWCLDRLALNEMNANGNLEMAVSMHVSEIPDVSVEDNFMVSESVTKDPTVPEAPIATDTFKKINEPVIASESVSDTTVSSKAQTIPEIPVPSKKKKPTKASKKKSKKNKKSKKKALTKPEAPLISANTPPISQPTTSSKSSDRKHPSSESLEPPDGGAAVLESYIDLFHTIRCGDDFLKTKILFDCDASFC